MFGSRLRFVFLTGIAAAILGAAAQAHAQGCIASRMNAPDGPTDPEGNSYYLNDGHWQASFGYRYFRSHRHFVGDVEQNAENVANGTAARDRANSEVVNHEDIGDVALSYGLSDRLSVNLDVPVLFLYRRNPQSAATATRPAVPFVYTDATGVGDINVLGRLWVAEPSKHNRQNLSVGFGFKLPTGKDNVQGNFLSVSNGQLVTTPHAVDQSIQLGDGGFGFLGEVQAFKSFGKLTAYANGSYLMNPRETNGVITGRSNQFEQVMSVPDQYAARIGVGYPVTHKLGASLSARVEGLPVHDLIGGSEGFRRPGYSIGIEPGLSYSWRGNALSLSVPYLVHRNRAQSVPDQETTALTGTYSQGDAAFADYIIIAGFTKRF